MYILPKPKNFIPEEGCFNLTYDKIIVISESHSPNAFYYARLLQDELKSVTGHAPAITYGNAAFKIGSYHDDPEKVSITPKDGAILFLTIAGFEKEEYLINIDRSSIVIEASYDNGLLYAVQTLRQIVRQCGYVLPCFKMRDCPGIENRGFYLDVTRGRVPTLSYLKKLADTLSLYKINQLQLYIEHSFLFYGLSEVWRDDTPLSSEDIYELDEYCKKLCIDLVPSISTFGHMYKILRTKSFRHMCELEETADEPFSFYDRMKHHTIDVTNDKSFSLVNKLIWHHLPLFSSEFFNICADETFDLGKGKSKETAEKEGIQRLYIDHVKRVCELIVSKGKKPMFWGDIICNFPELIKELPEDTICLNWGYDTDISDETTKKLKAAGAKIYNCPGVQGWNRFIPEYRTAYENIKRMCGYAYQYDAEGVLITDWGDYGHINHPDFSIPGLIYGAAFSWNNETESFEELNKAISAIEYCDRSETIMSVIADISDKWVFTWEDAVEYVEGKRDLKKPEQFSVMPGMLECLAAAEDRLRRLLTGLPDKSKDFVHALFVSIDGMKLIQKTGAVLCAHKHSGTDVIILDDKNGLPACAKKTAEALENWFMYYKEVWETVSRPSELYRVSDVIFKLADMLRDVN